MRQITIKRKKHFAGCAIDYYCILNIKIQDFIQIVDNDKFEKYASSILPLKSGKEITIEINNDYNTIFVIAYTSSGITLSNEIIIEEGRSDKTYKLITKYSFSKGSTLILVQK